MLLKMLLLLLPVFIWWENTENQNSEIAANTSEAGTCNFILFKKRLWQWCFPVNFAKFLRTPFWQITSGWLLLKWNKTKGLSLLIAFSSLSGINTTLKIGITITWSFTLRYVIATTSLWCWKKISYNDVTSISMRNRSISRCKFNKKSMPPQYRVPAAIFYSFF